MTCEGKRYPGRIHLIYSYKLVILETCVVELKIFAHKHNTQGPYYPLFNPEAAPGTKLLPLRPDQQCGNKGPTHTIHSLPAIKA
jgi:hypothetical protein